MNTVSERMSYVLGKYLENAPPRYLICMPTTNTSASLALSHTLNIPIIKIFCVLLLFVETFYNNDGNDFTRVFEIVLYYLCFKGLDT